MKDNQIPVPNLNRIIDELMSEHCQGVEKFHLEPQSETVTNAELETQPAVEETVEEGRAAKRQKKVSRTKEEETWSDKDFISEEAKDLWNRLLADKGFVSERGFWKMISHFSEIIEKRGWESFCAHTVPEFSALAREFYANMGGGERRVSLRARSLGTFWAQKNQRNVQIKGTQARF